MKLCPKQQTALPFEDMMKKDDSVNPGVFRVLVNFASKLDSDLKNHLETSAVFRSVSKTIQEQKIKTLCRWDNPIYINYKITNL